MSLHHRCRSLMHPETRLMQQILESRLLMILHQNPLKCNFRQTINCRKAIPMKSLPRSSRQKRHMQKYRTSGYTDQADAGTGTYAGGTGFYSNQNEHAVLMYKYGEQNYTEYYKKPVIKVHPGNLKFRKLLQDWKITRKHCRRYYRTCPLPVR